MADIDRFAFGRAVEHALIDRGLSYREAVILWPDLNVATISRAVNGFVLSAANMLLLCQCLELDPIDFLLPAARPHGGRRLPRYEKKQGVTNDTCETGIGDILRRFSGSAHIDGRREARP